MDSEKLFTTPPPKFNLRDKIEQLPIARRFFEQLGEKIPPNLQTLARIPLAPAVIGAHAIAPELGAVAFAALAILDWPDGASARAIRQESAVGAKLDPLVDKIVNGVIFAYLLYFIDDPIFRASIFANIAIDGYSTFSGGRILTRTEIKNLFSKKKLSEKKSFAGDSRANYFGKIKFALQSFAAVAALAGGQNELLRDICSGIFFTAAASGIAGIQKRKKQLSSSINLSELTKFPLNDDEVDIIETPAKFREDILRQIQNAQKRIYISTLYIENDTSGQKILAALRQAKNKNPNLEIKVFVDFHRNQRARIGATSKKTAADAFQAINHVDPQIEIIGIPVAVNETSGVLHTKGIVVDDTLTFSGASFNDVYLGTEKYRLDRYWKFENKNLADSFVRYFEEIFGQSSAGRDLTHGKVKVDAQLKQKIRELRAMLQKTNFSGSVAKIKDSQTYAIPIAGFKKDNPLNQIIVNLIRAAEKNVTIYTPYFNISAEVRSTIAAALATEIEIDIVVGDKTANDFWRSPAEIKKTPERELNRKEKLQLFLFDGLPFHYEQNLQKFAEEFREEMRTGLLNIYLWQNGENTFHPKGAVVDDGVATLITGHNINRRGDRKDLENGILVMNARKKMQLKVLAEKENILRHTKKLGIPDDLPSRSEYPFRARMACRVIAIGKNKS
ncbi:MAG: CDP-diacylglycerol--serine O-phosphatidyltransferase [Patescibacteria group bacterium]